MDHEAAMEMIPAYVLGALEGDQVRELEEHVRGCVECTAALGDHAQSAALIGAAAQPVAPPARIKTVLMKRIRSESTSHSSPAAEMEPVPLPEAPMDFAANRAWYSGPVGAAAAVTAAVVGVLFYMLVEIRSDLDTLKRVSIARDQNLIKIRERLERRDRFILALYSRDAQVASVSGKQVAAKANGSFVYLPHRRSAQFFISGLEKPPPGKSYQLWLIIDKKAKDGGLIAPENDGVTMAEIPVPADPSKVNAFAVSLEPRGGVPVRTGPIIILAPIDK